MFKFVIVSRVLPDFETTIKQEFYILFVNSKCKFESKLSKKKKFFFIFIL